MSAREKNRIRTLSRRRTLRNRARRQRELLTTALLLVFIAATCILLLKLTAMRTEADRMNTPLYKYYTTVEISSGDSLWSIAADHRGPGYENIRSYIDKIAAVNHLSGRYLVPGEKLCIPYYSTERL